MPKFLIRFIALLLIPSITATTVTCTDYHSPSPHSITAHYSMRNTKFQSQALALHVVSVAGYANQARVWAFQFLSRIIRWTHLSEDWISLNRPFGSRKWFKSMDDISNAELSLGLCAAQVSLMLLFTLVTSMVLFSPSTTPVKRVDAPTTYWDAVEYLLIATFLAPLIEEFARGLVTVGVAKAARKFFFAPQKKAFALGALLVTVSWASIHWFVIAQVSLISGIIYFGSILALGSLNSWLFYRTSRLTSSIISHSAYNFSLSLLILLLLFAGTQEMPLQIIAILFVAPVFAVSPLILWLIHRLRRQDLQVQTGPFGSPADPAHGETLPKNGFTRFGVLGLLFILTGIYYTNWWWGIAGITLFGLDALWTFQNWLYKNRHRLLISGRRFRQSNSQMYQEPWQAFIRGGIHENPAWAQDKVYEIFRMPGFGYSKALQLVTLDHIPEVKAGLEELIGKSIFGGVGLVIGFGHNAQEIIEVSDTLGWRFVHAVEFVNAGWRQRRVEKAAHYLASQRRSPKNIALYHADARNLQSYIKDDSIDGIYASNVVIKPYNGLENLGREVVRMLKPGGYAYLRVPGSLYPMQTLLSIFDEAGRVETYKAALGQKEIFFQKSRPRRAA